MPGQRSGDGRIRLAVNGWFFHRNFEMGFVDLFHALLPGLRLGRYKYLHPITLSQKMTHLELILGWVMPVCLPIGSGLSELATNKQAGTHTSTTTPWRGC